MLLFCAISVPAAELDDCQKLFREGQYGEVIQRAQAVLKTRNRIEEWPVLLVQSHRALGQYAEAEKAIVTAADVLWSSIRIHLLAYHVFRENGKREEAAEYLNRINDLGRRGMDETRDAANTVALGEAALLLGADPKLVLANFFEPAKRAAPNDRHAYEAAGNLALQKSDFRIAARNFDEGLKKFPDDPDFLYGLAKAFAPDDRKQMMTLLELALEKNENHVPSILLIADHCVDAEEYDEVEKLAARALKINPRHPEAWAYRAIIAHLRNNSELEKEARSQALSNWKSNPRVDFLIGQKLSQKYRFAEGAGYQRQSVKFDGNYLPAKSQLAQDLLRLGEEDEGWSLAKEVFEKDEYDAASYNLVTLHDTLSKFETRRAQDFVLRMHPHEASIYGNRAMNLLQRARGTLNKKYGFEPDKPTTVEIFPQQKDFAIRTFGMPGGAGYLGVCFGCLVTANSPASQRANPTSWEAVLWHEYCHVVTLGLTKNKMPRWLSEGISVYEERQENPSWGQVMTPKYREMIVKGELTPIGELSGAFLTPKTPLHLQFAYYQSSLVVEFLVSRYGLDSVKSILRDLGDGRHINDSIEARSTKLATLEKDFVQFARARADQLGRGLDWSQQSDSPLASVNQDRNYYHLIETAKNLLGEKKYAEAKAPLEKILEHYPDDASSDSPYLLLAAAHRGLKETDKERAALARIAALDSDASAAFARLMEIDAGAASWSSVAENAERYLAVDPLVPLPYHYLAEAAEGSGKTNTAVGALETALLLNPRDPASVHLKLGHLMAQTEPPKAKRHVLEALEEAPRYRDAHRLLLELKRAATNAAAEPKSVSQ